MLLHLKIFSVLCLVLPWSLANAADPAKKSFSGIMSGTMKSGLPISTNNSFINRIIYPRGGEFLFYSSRWCGDSDVAHYYEKNAQEDSGKGAATVKMVLGYWIDDASAASSVPTESNWFSIAYGTLDVNGSAISNLYRSSSGQKMSASKTLLNEYSRLMGLAKLAPAGKNLKLYSAAMVCHEYQGLEGTEPEKEAPVATQISNQLVNSGSSLYAKMDSMSSDDKFEKAMKLDITYNKDQITLSVGSAGKTIANSYLEKAKSINNFSYPSNAKNPDYKVGNYRGDVSGLVSKIGALVTSCDQELSNSTKKYWFEPFALNITCNYLHKANLIDLKNKLNMQGADSDSNSVISESLFKKYRDQVADAVATAAVLDEAQKILEDDKNINRNKTRCFDPSQRYLNKILASMVLPFEKKADGGYSFGDLGKMSLPESNYALGGAEPYYKNDVAVFMNYKSVPKRPGLEFSRNEQPSMDFAAALDFNFHIRDIGCSDGPFYCKVDASPDVGVIR